MFSYKEECIKKVEKEYYIYSKDSNATVLIVNLKGVPNYIARLYKYDLNKAIIKNEWTVAHGLNSSAQDNRVIAVATGNSLTGRRTAEGWYSTHGYTESKYKEAIKLIGLQKGINCNALKRGIVIHPADYMEEEHKAKFCRYGWSWGNFAVSQATFDDLKKYSDNTLMYVHI